MSEEDTRKRLAESIDHAEWSWLKSHLERDALIIVSLELDFIDVGVKLVENDAAAVQAWIDQKLLAKPDAAQIAAWDAEPAKTFPCLIVQPYVLIQTEPGGVIFGSA